MADGLSANATNDPETRRRLRNRSRYEVANNCYAAGLLDTIADDLIGTGPRLQLNTGTDNREADRAVEILLARWFCDTGFCDKLRIMHLSRQRDGECYGLFTHNRQLPDSGVQLDVRLIETDQCDTPWPFITDATVVDGVKIDQQGNPLGYYFSKHHPGENTWGS